MLKLSPTLNGVYKTKQEYVYQILRNAIMKCELSPGEKLVIRDIASQLEVSAIPVREALQLLQSEDLVTYGHHVGAIVAPITKDSIAETFTIKEGLEGAATREAMKRMTPKEFASLEEQLAEMDAVIKNQENERWGHLNAQFHKSIVQMTGMPLLKEMHTKILDKWDRIRRYFFYEVVAHRHNQSQKEHHAMVKAMKENNFKEAERLTKEHNWKALHDYMQHFEETEKTEVEHNG